MKYFLLMDYGSHKRFVRVPKKDFFDWLDNLLSEFEVYTLDFNSSQRFYITDYLGNPYCFGERRNNE